MNSNLSIALTNRSARIGLIIILVTGIASYALFSKDRIGSLMMGGETIEVAFDEAYKLRPDVSQVKVAYVVVGKVIGLKKVGDGAVYELKIHDDVFNTLGSEPTATIRSTTILGGNYFVDLQPGGDPGAFGARSIPVERTRVPVELDKVARALQPTAREGLQGTVRSLDKALDQEGRDALSRLLETAPQALESAPGVLAAAQGENPEQDLPTLVSYLENTGRVLTARDGELAGIVEDLAATGAVLDRRSREITRAIEKLPKALRSTDQGLDDLSGTLTTLEDVSEDARPLVKQLNSTLETLQPLLREARPLIADARPLLADARPMVRDLRPTVVSGEQIVDDLEGPVLERLNDAVGPWLHKEYDGVAPYAQTKSEKVMYQELAYTLANLHRAATKMDANGHAISLHAGINAESIVGVPISLEQLVQVLLEASSAGPNLSLPALPTLQSILAGQGGN